MALSNWASVGWTEDLQSFDPQMVTRNGYILEFYKDWVYVKKPDSESTFSLSMKDELVLMGFL